MPKYNNNKTTDSKNTTIDEINQKKSGNTRKRGNGNNPRRASKNNSKGSSNASSFNKFYHDMFNNAGDLGKSSNSFPFANVAGFPIHFNSNALSMDNGNLDASEIQLPSLMVLESILTPGYSGDNGSALNVAANKLFAEMRRYNTSVEVYDAVDVMEYILACDMAFAIHSYFASAYALLNNVEWSNRFIPRALCEARGFDYDDLAIHQTELRNALNTFRVQMGAMNIPNAFAFMNYHATMYANVYKDADNFRAQLYSVIPHIYYVFQEGANGDEPGKLVPKAFPTKVTHPGEKAVRRLTVSDIDNILKAIVTPITTSGSFSLISGDMLKLTDFTMLSLDEVTETTVATPVYDPEFLQDLKNATIYINSATRPAWNIPTSDYDAETGCYCIQQTPDVGGIRFQPAIRGLSISADKIVDIDADLPTPEEFYIATRHITSGVKAYITNTTDAETGNKYSFAVANPVIMGFDYYVKGTIYMFNVAENTATETDWNTVAPGINDAGTMKVTASDITTDFVIDVDDGVDTHVSQKVLREVMDKLTAMSKFSVVPRTYLFIRKISKGTSIVEFVNILNDVYNIAAVDPMKLLDTTTTTYLTAYSLVRK